MRTIEDLHYCEHRLEASERPKAFYTYYVSGTGEFPFDMIRHDSAWPSSGDDASKLDASVLERSERRRSIKLCSYRRPTVDRWSSFGWSCGPRSIY